LIYETIGFWIKLPAGLPAVYTERGLHFMGGIHASEHAIIGLFPLLAIADRGDVAGISYTGHPQTGTPAIFIYDSMPGGAGLAEQGFRDLETLLGRTLELVSGCACEDGCPGCIHSPSCGNGNKPLDKVAAVLTLRSLLGKVAFDTLGVEPPDDRVTIPAPRPEPVAAPATPERPSRKHGITRAGNLPPEAARPTGAEHVVVLDIETQRSAADVGGWHHADRMGLALAVVYDVQRGVYRTYYEADVQRLLLDLVMADRVIGFNIDRFDLVVLSGYTEQDLSRIRTMDMLSAIHRQLGFRLSLNHLTAENLGESKSADGLQSLRWWKDGRIDLIESYCRKDVEVTRRLFELGRERGYLLYRDHSDRRVRVPVAW